MNRLIKLCFLLQRTSDVSTEGPDAKSIEDGYYRLHDLKSCPGLSLPAFFCIATLDYAL